MTEKLSVQFDRMQNEARTMFHNRHSVGLSVRKIENDTGLSIGWLQAFARGVSKQSRIEYVEQLHEYLQAKGLSV